MENKAFKHIYGENFYKVRIDLGSTEPTHSGYQKQEVALGNSSERLNGKVKGEQLGNPIHTQTSLVLRGKQQ